MKDRPRGQKGQQRRSEPQAKLGRGRGGGSPGWRGVEGWAGADRPRGEGGRGRGEGGSGWGKGRIGGEGQNGRRDWAGRTLGGWWPLALARSQTVAGRQQYSPLSPSSPSPNSPASPSTPLTPHCPSSAPVASHTSPVFSSSLPLSSSSGQPPPPQDSSEISAPW